MRQPTQRPGPNQRSELAQALASCRGAFVATALMSGMSNILMLTGAIFMLEIYDRVLPSRSIPTLVALVILAAGLFLAQGLLDIIRGRILVRIGARLDEELSSRVYETVVRLPLKVGNRSDGLQQLRDLDSVRSFLSGPGPTALFDLPWLPIYLAICFVFHPYIGLAALVGAIVLGCLALMTEVLTREPTRAATGFATTRSALAEASRRNAEAMKAMGMVPRVAALWQDANSKYMASQQQAADVSGGFGSMSKALRMMLQSGVLAVGAYLVINQQATAGIIIAGAILSARALAPVDLAIANWRGFVSARQSWQRLTKLLAALPPQLVPMALPPPQKSLAVEGVTIAPPGSERIVVHDVSFNLQSGHGLGIIGPSGSGKSSLARMLIGVWQPVRGRVRLDGASLDQWPPDILGASLAICRKMLNCWPAPWRRTSPALPLRWTQMRSSARPPPPACTISSSVCPMAMKPRWGRVAPRFPPDRRNASRSRVHCMAIRSWSFLTSRTPISILRATRRSAAPSWACARGAGSSSWSRIGPARSQASTCC